MNGEDQYLEANVMTATPYQLHRMVVDGAIRFAVQAEAAIEQGDIEAAHIALNSSREFVAELISGLDENNAPELVGQLKSLFCFVYKNLAEADFEQNIEHVTNALSILRMHRETWVELAEKINKEVAERSAVPAPKSLSVDASQQTSGKSWTT